MAAVIPSGSIIRISSRTMLSALRAVLRASRAPVARAKNRVCETRRREIPNPTTPSRMTASNISTSVNPRRRIMRRSTRRAANCGPHSLYPTGTPCSWV